MPKGHPAREQWTAAELGFEAGRLRAYACVICRLPRERTPAMLKALGESRTHWHGKTDR